MLELLTPQEAAKADAAMVKRGVPIRNLMERAGYAVADQVAAETGFGVSIVAVAGPGDNGGDAFVAAEVLRARGFKIALIDLSNNRGSDAALAAQSAYAGETITADDPRVARADIFIDGLFGGGLSRPLDGEAAHLVEHLNALPGRTFAIDLPSGVNGATGEVDGPAIEAVRTITFQRRKPGHFLYPGRAHVGRLTVADIGMPDRVIADVGCQTRANERALWDDAIPQLDDSGHKYRRGHAVILSGPMLATGAARMAAMAALRAGAGLVTLASPASALMVNASHLTAIMLKRVDDAGGLTTLLSDARHNVICLGPGLPPDGGTQEMVEAACQSSASVVLDAGALSAFAGAPADLCAKVSKGTVITPHEGEFARIFGRYGDKLSDARRAAADTGAVVVLKGADTVVAHPDGRAAINANAPPWLATAGTGDVLAGIITAMLAQGVAPFEAAAMAVHIHGAAAHNAGAGMVVDDLIAALHRTMGAFITGP